MTELIKVTPENISDLKKAGEIIKKGGLVAFPTETVYGIGANGLDGDAVKNIFKAKGRPSDNPLILHIADFEEAENIGEMNSTAKIIGEKFWPGPITIVVNKKQNVPDAVTAGLNTVAIRMPSHYIARQIIKYAGVPIAAPSANISGKPSPTCAKHVIEDLNGKVDMIIDGGRCDIGIESTVIDTTGEKPLILRPGGITYEQLKEILPNVEVEQHTRVENPAYKPRSPGMKYKHYAPKAKVIVFEGNALEKIEEELKICAAKNKKAGVFCSDNSNYTADLIIKWGTTPKDMAQRVFWALREFDEKGMDVILCEMPDKCGIGMGVRNRLYKAAAYDIR